MHCLNSYFMMKSFRAFILFMVCCFFVSFLPIHAQKKQDNGYTYKNPSADGTGKVYMGREIAKVMDASGYAWLERNSRPQEENTNLAISKLPVTSSGTAADIGAGTGYYTFRIASKVSKGKVYAVEIQDEYISFLNNKKKELRVNNVEVIKGDSVSPNLPVNSIDMAIMVDVYHELIHPVQMLQSIRKALKPNGKIVLLEYKAEDPAVAIKKLHKMSVAQVSREMAANGFELSYRGDFLPIQHFLVYEKIN